MAKKQKEKSSPWEDIDQQTVESLTNEFKIMFSLYTSQGVDPLAIASAFLASGQWAMNKEIGLKDTQDLLRLLSNYIYEVVPQLNRTIH
jgi:hypothetical protein